MNKVIVHIPHSSTDIPEEYKNLFVVDDKTLDKELLLMTDKYTDELFEHENNIVFPVSRLVCDVERFRNEADEEMTEKGMWVCYEKTSDGKELKLCTEEHKKQILTELYETHHKRLTNAVKNALNEYGECIIVDAHSFSSVPLPHELSQETPRPDICIGTDDFHTPRWLLGFCGNRFIRKGYSVKINKPFSGSIVPSEFYGKDKNIQSVMIEINRSLYMNEQTGEKSSNYSKVKSDIQEVLTIIGNYKNYLPIGNLSVVFDKPYSEITPKDVDDWLSEDYSELKLAVASEIAHLKRVHYQWDSSDCEYKDEFFDRWSKYEDELIDRIVLALEKENLSGVANHDLSEYGNHYKIRPFMERNDFFDGDGWWIYKSDKWIDL